MCGFSGLPKLRQLVSPSGSAPDAGEVARALEHRLDRARVRIAGHAPAVAVDRHGDRAAAAVGRELEHRGVGRLRPAHGARADDRVVLLEGEALGGHVRRAEQGQQGARRRRRPAPMRAGGSG